MIYKIDGYKGDNRQGISINGHSKIGRFAGRTKCTLSCCTNPLLILGMYKQGMSSYDIAKKVGSSSTHIMQRLHKIGISTKGRGSYRRPKTKKIGNINKLSDKELYLEDIREVGERLIK